MNFHDENFSTNIRIPILIGGRAREDRALFRGNGGNSSNRMMKYTKELENRSEL